jgi:hypothetical protein
VKQNSSPFVQPASKSSGLSDEQVAFALSGRVERRTVLRSAQILQELQQKL